MARFPEAEARLLHRKICMKCNARNAMRAARCRKCSYKGLRLKNVERKGIWLPYLLRLFQSTN